MTSSAVWQSMQSIPAVWCTSALLRSKKRVSSSCRYSAGRDASSASLGSWRISCQPS